MTRSGYVDDWEENWLMYLYRGTVERSIKGRRGQKFLKRLLAALDALPEKSLIVNDLVTKEGDCCAIGAVAVAEGIDVSGIDPEDPSQVGKVFGISRSMAAEIEYMNDEWGSPNESPERRWQRMREWVCKQLIK